MSSPGLDWKVNWEIMLISGSHQCPRSPYNGDFPLKDVIVALCHTLLLAQLSFCAHNIIPHYFCDLGALLKLSCSDTSVNELVIFTVGLAVITYTA